MALLKQKYTRTNQSVVLGLLGDLVGKKDQISFIPKNFESDKAVMLILDYADGTSDTVVCSNKLSEMVRAKTVTMGNLLTLEVHEFITAEGDAINIVQLPLDEANRKVSIAVKDIKATPMVAASPSVKTFAQSISLG